ncbi:MAG: cation:proton antiporter [Thiotrichales bacterium]|nr:cation:proton antiporter [Thiotrichales bacterium]MCY4286360.1 cation:proton antiporter [Thiotrichales bacterium]MCY4350755.1 cation:proton antiporter [Thiotrichales bacterium]
MHGESILDTIFLIFTGGAIVAGLALFARQSMLIAYIALGVLVGPWGFALIEDATTAQGIGEVGIIFLLYLLGLNLHPQKLARMMREATIVTLGSSLVFAAAGFGVALAFGFTTTESLVIGALSMFSSTIIGLKLLPTTTLHHRHTGEIVISVLLLQDVIAIVALLGLDAMSRPNLSTGDAAWLAAALPVVVVAAAVMERWVLTPLIRRFDTIREYIFLAAIGWCLGIAQLGHAMGLSQEIGAFVAGVALARSPVATFIAESLKPLRDFFLVMFFFALGAAFPIPVLAEVALPAVCLGGLMLVLKPVVFHWLLRREHESSRLSMEIGVRLGQLSEFSLLIAAIASQGKVIGPNAAYAIHAATLLTFIVSSYLIMLRYPTPIAVTESLRRD